MTESINWKLFLILFGLSMFGVIAVIPYILTIQTDMLKELPIPLHTLLTIQIVQNAILFALLTFVGLYLAQKVGLGVPILKGWLEGKEVKTHFKSIFGISVISGVAVGILIFGINHLISIFIEPATITQPSSISPPAWQSFLASFYGGISEEVIMRLFLMTLLVWVFYKIKRAKEDKPTNLSVWLAIIITSILFGAGHLPFVTTLTTITPLLIIRIVALNSIGGIVFGWLYWKKG